jgi:hypothetical protein
MLAPMIHHAPPRRFSAVPFEPENNPVHFDCSRTVGQERIGKYAPMSPRRGLRGEHSGALQPYERLKARRFQYPAPDMLPPHRAKISPSSQQTRIGVALDS